MYAPVVVTGFVIPARVASEGTIQTWSFGTGGTFNVIKAAARYSPAKPRNSRPVEARRRRLERLLKAAKGDHKAIPCALDSSFGMKRKRSARCGLKGVHFICKSCRMHAGTIVAVPRLPLLPVRFDGTREAAKDADALQSRRILVSRASRRKAVDPNTVPPPGSWLRHATRLTATVVA